MKQDAVLAFERWAVLDAMRTHKIRSRISTAGVNTILKKAKEFKTCVTAIKEMSSNLDSLGINELFIDSGSIDALHDMADPHDDTVI